MYLGTQVCYICTCLSYVNHSTHSSAARSCKTLFLLKCCSSENMHYPVFAQVLLITNMQYPVFAHVLLIVYFGEAWKGWFGWGHSITTWTRWGGSGSKNVCFCPRSGYKNSPQAICFVNSVCTILSLRKKGTPHKILFNTFEWQKLNLFYEFLKLHNIGKQFFILIHTFIFLW